MQDNSIHNMSLKNGSWVWFRRRCTSLVGPLGSIHLTDIVRHTRRAVAVAEERCELGQPLQPRSLDGVRVLLRCRLGDALTGEEALVRRLRPKVSDLRTRTGRRESRVRKAEGRKRRGAARRAS